MARPNWEYIRVDVLLPDHPKLDGLSTTAKWTLLELWCWCGQNRTDGFVRASKWRTFGTPAVRAALVKARLAEEADGGMQMHDYLDHQRSRAEIAELSAKRSSSGRKGGKASARAKADARASAVASGEADADGPEPVDNSESGPHRGGRRSNSDRPPKISTGQISDGPDGETAGQGRDGPKQLLKQNASKFQAEAEAEADIRADVVDHLSRRSARNGDDDEIDLVISEIHLATGRTISREWAADVRAMLLNGRDVTNPAAYLRQIIRTERDPAARFLPLASSHPSSRPVAEAVMAAGIVPNGTPLRGADVVTKAAAVRAALHAPKDPT